MAELKIKGEEVYLLTEMKEASKKLFKRLGMLSPDTMVLPAKYGPVIREFWLSWKTPAYLPFFFVSTRYIWSENGLEIYSFGFEKMHLMPLAIYLQ